MNRLRPDSVIGLLIIVFGLAGCVTTSQPDTINALFVQNRTESSLTNIRLRVPTTGAIVSCSFIPPNGECSLGFPARENQGNPVTISWIQDDNTYSQTLYEDMIPYQSDGSPLTFYLNIYDYGVIRAGLD